MNKDLKYDFDDLVIVPEIISNINSRKDVNPYTKEARLPLMVSPMDTVICETNWQTFLFDGDMLPCLPRNEYVNSALVFNSISLDEFEQYIVNEENGIATSKFGKLLVDIANGHLVKLVNLTSRFMKLPVRPTLMVGNIANPKTYEVFAALGVDFIRCGIGGGSACTTSANTGVHYPMASLIAECYEIKKKENYNSKIVADGGFKNFDDIIKALALGADYVMLGSILNKCLESCADTYLHGINVNWCKDFLWNCGNRNLYKSYRGMSTKAVQQKWNRKELRTSEGISKTNKVEYTVKQWRENFEDYLRSAMSYTNSKTLDEFKESQRVFITNNAKLRYKK